MKASVKDTLRNAVKSGNGPFFFYQCKEPGKQRRGQCTRSHNLCLWCQNGMFDGVAGEEAWNIEEVVDSESHKVSRRFQQDRWQTYIHNILFTQPLPGAPEMLMIQISCVSLLLKCQQGGKFKEKSSAACQVIAFIKSIFHILCIFWFSLVFF